MKCPDCGVEVDDAAAVCPRCALPLDRTMPRGLETRVTARSPAAAPPAVAAPAPTGETPPPARKKDIESRMLISPALAVPVDLIEGRAFRIGRDRSSAVCLPSSHVSRMHAEVMCEKGQWYVSDLNSRNGTFVNGERVIKRRLADQDRISIGSFEVVYRELTRAEALEAREKQRLASVTDDTTRVRLLHERDGVYGDVQKVTVFEVVQLLSQNRRTGCLTVTEVRAGAEPRPGAERRLWFQDGAIVHAQGDRTEGEAVVAPALAVHEGKFFFEPAVVAPRVTIHTPTAALLLGAIS